MERLFQKNMNFLFISPNFPIVYYKFVKALKQRGLTCLGIGDSPANEICPELKENLTEYYVVSNMQDYAKMKEAIAYYEKKYGHIDYLESNNEFWLIQDAKLRKEFNITTGMFPDDMDKIKYKSKMKEYFAKAGMKNARFTLISTLENSLNFAKEVGYPLFIKPDCGVGAAHTQKINNEEELIKFHSQTFETQFIMEEFINGEIISFDGICDEDSNVPIAFKEEFPIPVADVVNNDLDDFYFATTTMDDAYRKMGERIIKTFGIKKRCFHIELWKLLEDRPGLANKGEIIALECNMRSPGGYTPELLSIALGNSYYDVYADIIAYNKTPITPMNNKFYAISVAKKDRFSYIHSNDEIATLFKPFIIESGRYPKSIADAMGDEYFFGKFNELQNAITFQNYVQKKCTK